MYRSGIAHNPSPTPLHRRKYNQEFLIALPKYKSLI